MQLELSEVFVCPACRPAQGLVVLVDEIEDRRVRTGHLGCPECELRVPIRQGVLRFDRAEDTGGTEGGEAGPLADVGAEEAALRLAALLGADRAEGPLLLGPGLAALAGPLAALAAGSEVLALETGPPGARAEAAGPVSEAEPPRERPGPGGADRSGVSRAVGLGPEALPIVSGRLAGVALLRPDAAAVREAIRALEEGGRLVLLEPTEAARQALEGEPVRIAATEPGTAVAVREPGPARARS